MKKLILALLILALGFALISCTSAKDSQATAPDAEKTALEIAESYKGLLQQGADMGAVLASLGEQGYPAVDETAALPFVNADKLRAFAREYEEGIISGAELVRVCVDGGLIYTRFYYADTWHCKNVRVGWHEGKGEVSFASDYVLSSLTVTDKDYLIYTCEIPDNTAASKHDGYIVPTTMLRLTPRSEEVSRFDKYLVPIGYNANELFTRSWTASNLSGVCLNDVYLSLWRAEHGAYLYYFDDPYENLEGTAFSLVPKGEFEALMQKYLALSEHEIASASVYNEAHSAYPIDIIAAHRSDSVPVPEVTAVQENPDGTYTLTVEALYVERATDCAFTHYVTLAPNGAGELIIAGNERIYSDSDIVPEYISSFEH